MYRRNITHTLVPMGSVLGLLICCSSHPFQRFLPPPRKGCTGELDVLAGMIPPIYSLSMKYTALLTLLVGIMAVGFGSLTTRPELTTAPTQPWWISFLVLVPLCLAVLIWWGYWWATMACVMYGTVGLALDLATNIQILTNDSEIGPYFLSNLISGCLNFLLILFGGRSFLDATRTPTPQESHSPNPPSTF